MPMSNTEYYEFLGVGRGAGDEEIKKAYRRLALEHHPDKQGDPEKFKKLTDVYDVLKDPAKRRVYDQHGPDAAKQGQGRGQPFPSGFSVEEVFGTMFGGFHGFQQTRPAAAADANKRKPKPVKHTVLLSMEELYRGKKLRIAVQRAIVCPKCVGEGGKDISERPCVACAGKGFSVTSHGSVFRSSIRCQACDATGRLRKIGDPCIACKSTGMSTERIVLEPVVNPGDRTNMSYVFRGKGDFSNVKGSLPGDVVITTAQKPSAAFTRKGHDLYTDMHISLKESLTGFSKSVKHLDDRMIEISVPRGKVTPPETVVRVKNEGIPATKGALFVTIKVKFPSHFSDSSTEMLDILPEFICL
ncbi:unnamed protein product [Ectocarpus sp. 8 AP-2014]